MDVKLIVVGGKNAGREIPVVGSEFWIGRGEDCQLRPASDRISRHHCAIVIEPGRVLARDKGSTNGTQVNGEKLVGERELKNDDVLKIGGVIEFKVQLTVTLAGTKKPKVQSIQEAVARTAQKKSSNAEDDIASWLEDGGDEDAEDAPPLDLSLKETAAVNKLLSDTTTILVPSKPDEKDKKAPHKPVGQFERANKPKTENSQAAANDVLRAFFGRKK